MFLSGALRCRLKTACVTRQSKYRIRAMLSLVLYVFVRYPKASQVVILSSALNLQI